MTSLSFTRKIHTFRRTLRTHKLQAMTGLVRQGGLLIWAALMLGCVVDLGQGLEFPGAEGQWTRFPKWNACCESEMSFNMKTKSASGLVVYFDDEGFCDFLELILHEGRLRLSFSIFCAEPAILLTDTPVNDNDWHSVVIRRNFKNTTLILDKEAKWVEVKSKRRDMTVFSSLFIGGIPPELRAATLKLTFSAVKDHEPYRGWISDVRVNYTDSAPLESKEVKVADERDPCSGASREVTCLNGGVCKVVNDEAVCDCAHTGYQGKDCSEASSEEEGGDGAVEPSGGDASTGQGRTAQPPSQELPSSGSEGAGAASATTAVAEGPGEPPQGLPMAEDGVEPSRLVVSTEEEEPATEPHMGPGGGSTTGAGGAVQGQGQEAAQVTVEGPVHVADLDPVTAPSCTSREAPSQARPQVGESAMPPASPLPAGVGSRDRFAAVLVGAALKTRVICDDVRFSWSENARHHSEQRRDAALLGGSMVGGFQHVSRTLADLSSSVEAIRQSFSTSSSGPDSTRAPCGPGLTNTASLVEIPSLPQSGVAGPAGVDPTTGDQQMEDVQAPSDRAHGQQQQQQQQEEAVGGSNDGSGPSSSEGQASAGGQEDPGRDVSSVWQRLGQRIDAERQRAEEERLTMVRAESSMRWALRRVECLEAARRELEVDMALALRGFGDRTETRLRGIDMEFEDALAHNITE